MPSDSSSLIKSKRDMPSALLPSNTLPSAPLPVLISSSLHGRLELESDSYTVLFPTYCRNNEYCCACGSHCDHRPEYCPLLSKPFCSPPDIPRLWRSVYLHMTNMRIIRLIVSNLPLQLQH
jgi:hypothetical protein